MWSALKSQSRNGSEAVETDVAYIASPSAVAIHKRSLCLRVLVEEFSRQGLHYYWTWAYNHIGYDPVKLWPFFRVNPWRRMRFWYPIWMINGLPYSSSSRCPYKCRWQKIAVASVHLSWWDKGFQFEWPRIEARFSQVGNAGDFNNPAGQEGYETILSS